VFVQAYISEPIALPWTLAKSAVVRVPRRTYLKALGGWPPWTAWFRSAAWANTAVNP